MAIGLAAQRAANLLSDTLHHLDEGAVLVSIPHEPGPVRGERVLEWEDTRRDYGELRIIAIGEIDGEIYVVVYTPRGEVRRIISARPASRRERDAYRQTFAK